MIRLLQKIYLDQRFIDLINKIIMNKEFDLAFEALPKGQTQCGCYVTSPQLVKQHPGQSILMPLKSSEYQLEIVNSISQVKLTQNYLNPTEQFLEVQYNFPIHPEACVYHFVANFGNTRIEGVVKEKEQAKKEYQQAVKEGKRAAYGELNSKSKDILTLKVGNIPPRENVQIEIFYLQELAIACNTFYQLHMVGTISPRYMNFIPGEVVREGLRNEAAKVKGDFYWNFKISLKTSRKVIFFDSNSHKLELTSQNEHKTSTQLVMAQQCLPNRDFFFTYTTEDFERPSYVFGNTDAGSTAVVSFIPKFCHLNLDDAYKASIEGKGFQTDIDSARGEYVFLLDRSGSMGGSRIKKATQSLTIFLKSLPLDTYFNVISFGSVYEKMFPSSVKYTNEQLEKAVSKVKEMRADLGGTEIYQPLKELITGKLIEGYPKQIFLLTDGDVDNTQGVIRMVELNTRYSRVHTIGIGNGCSEDLIMGCAKKGKGYHVFISDMENPSQKIIKMLTDSLSPVISQMKLTYDPEVVQSVIPNPQSLSYVLKDQLVNFYVSFKGHLKESTIISFGYEDSVNKQPHYSDIEVNPQASSIPFVDKMGQFKKIRLLQDAYSNSREVPDLMAYAKVQSVREQIQKQSVKHQILSSFTAFVCVQKELTDGQYHEVKGKGQVAVSVQPVAPSAYAGDKIEYGYEEQEQDMCMGDMFGDGGGGGYSGYRSSAPPKPQYCCMEEEEDEDMEMGDMFGDGGGGGQLYARYLAPPQKKQCVMKKEDEEEEEEDMDMGDLFDGDGGEYSYSPPVKSQKVEEKKPKTLPNKMQPGDLIDFQTAEGAWKEVGLLEKLFSVELKEEVSKDPQAVVIVTYLVAKWIEKHYPGNQYSLIVKKAFKYIQKNGDLKKLSELYDKYLT